MSNMAAVIAPKSDQINADDLIAGEMTITITGVTVTGGTEQPVSISFSGSSKVYRPCKSMSRVLVAAWGPDANQYTGRTLTLYRDPTVKWGGMAVGGIRIGAMSHIERELVLMLTMTKQNRAPHKVKVLKENPTAIAQQAAKEAAKGGTAAMRAYWQGLSPATRDMLASVIADCKRIAAEADEAKTAAMVEEEFLGGSGAAEPNHATTTGAEIYAQIAAETAARDAAYTSAE